MNNWGEFEKGFSSTNTKQMRSFYLTYSKSQTVSDEFNLSWSHYLTLPLRHLQFPVNRHCIASPSEQTTYKKN